MTKTATAFLTLFCVGCAELPEPEYIYGGYVEGLEFIVLDVDQGVHPNASIMQHPENPFRRGISLESRFAVQSAGPVAAFYGWATSLVQEPTGEHQFYAASAARDIYFSERADPEDLVFARDIAVRGYREVLLSFPDSAGTYDATGTVRFDLLGQTIDGIVSLGGVVPPGWSVVESPDGTRTGVYVGGP
ncbi:MAG: hypothetical protein AB8H79_10750 [Myxococcota bacterium]